jgi:hypothetical protein
MDFIIAATETGGAISPQATVPAVVILMAAGLLFCFFGYRIFMLTLGVMGFVLGAFVASGFACGSTDSTIVHILAGLCGGIAGSVLMVVFYFVGIFIFGAALGAAVGAAVYPALIVVLLFAVVFGVLAVVFQRALVVVATALDGAGLVVAGIFYFILGHGAYLSIARQGSTLADTGTGGLVMLILWLVLGAAGMVVQFKVTAKKKLEEEKARGPRKRRLTMLRPKTKKAK